MEGAEQSPLPTAPLLTALLATFLAATGSAAPTRTILRQTCFLGVEHPAGSSELWTRNSESAEHRSQIKDSNPPTRT